MATKMSFNYFQSQNGKYNTILPKGLSKDMDVSHDLHLKMSKKIAQLTKVIYALNTKNDEHEAVVQSLKDTHEEEMQQLLAETRKKIAVYQARVTSEVDSKNRIESLETSVVQYQNQQQQAHAQFENFKRKAEEQLCDLKRQHAEKMLELSQDVLKAKTEFSEQLQKFDEFQARCVSDNQKTVDELIKKHETDLEFVRNCQGSQNEETLQEVCRLKEKHNQEIELLNQKYENLQKEKSKSDEDYESKLEKSQAFYEKELEALKTQQTSSQDSIIQSLKEQEDKMRKDHLFQEGELRKQIDSLIQQSAENEDGIETYQSKISQLEDLLQKSKIESETLVDKLKDVEDKLSSSLNQVNEQQTELSTLQHKVTGITSESEQKSVLISDLEKSKMLQKQNIEELNLKLSNCRSMIEDLEAEKHKQQNEQQISSEKQLKLLKQQLEDLVIEKQTMEQRYEREIQGLKDLHVNKEKEWSEEHASSLSQLRLSLEAELEKEKKDSADSLTQTEQYWQKRYDDEINKLTGERESILAEFEKVKSELFSKLKTAEEEIKRLESSVEDSQQGLGSATSHMNNLKDAAGRLKGELDNTRSELKSSKITVANLKAEIEKLHLQHNSQIAEAELKAKVTLESLKTELNNEWTETLQIELNKLRKQITDQYESEKNSAIIKLTKNHETEIKNITAEWELKVTSLTVQITDLQRNANKTNSKSVEEIERIRQEMVELEKQLRLEMLQAGEEYARKISVMESAQENQLKSLIDRKDKETSELEKRLKDKHVEDIQIQLTAHRAAVQNIQEQADKLRHDRETSLIKQHQQDIDKLKLELSEKLENELRDGMKKHENEIRAARIELERAIEISKQNDRDNNTRTEELHGEIASRERTIRNLEDEVRSLKRYTEELKRDMKERDKEIKQIKNEAKVQIRNLEEEFKKEYQRNIDNLQADHIRNIEDMVGEFNQAQALLKDKISTMQLQLEEAEEMYRNRDSRPEDLELIMQLRDSIQERELRVKELIDEKRFFQLELVNRETNFNKIFNTAPNIGVMNPLTTKNRGKKGEKPPLKHSSAPTLSHRLTPIQNSPKHDERLNPTKPLPVPAFNKKFVN